MRVLVVGGAGFLGRAFVRHYKACGDQVIAIDDLSNPASYWPRECLGVTMDAIEALTSHNTSWIADQDFDLALHFAGDVGGRAVIEGDPLRNATSLSLDLAFFQWAVKHTKLAVYPSSSAVYPAAAQAGEGERLRESLFDPRNGRWGKPDAQYGFGKLAGEVLAELAATKYGLNTLCIRPFSGFGEDQGPEYPIPAIAARVARREDPLVIWGSGDQRRDFVYIDDIVGATQARLDAGVEGYQSLNIGSGVATSFREVAEDLVFAAYDPHRPLYSPQVVTDSTKPEGVHSRFCDPTLMLSYYTPKVSLAAGLARVLAAQEAKL